MLIFEPGRAREEAKVAQLGATNIYHHRHELAWNRGKALAQNCMTHFQGNTEWLQMLGLQCAQPAATLAQKEMQRNGVAVG